MAPLVECALALARVGFAVLPVRADKKPACRHGYCDATRAPEMVARLFAANPAPLVAVATGAPSGAALLDIDPPAGLVWLDAHAHRLPETVSVRTPRGGWHLWFAIDGDLPRSTVGTIAPGIDTRGAGGYGIAWQPAALIEGRARMASWPDWLSEALRPAARAAAMPLILAGRGAGGARRYAVAALRSAVERVACAREGTRNATLNKEAYCLARFLGSGIASGELADSLAVAAEVAGLSAREARATIASALQGRARR